MGLPNIGGNFARKRVRKSSSRTRSRRIKKRKALGKPGAILAHYKKHSGTAKKAARNIIIAGTDPTR